MALAKAVLYMGLPFLLVIIVLRRLHAPHPRRFRWYAIFSLLTVPLVINDAFLIHHIVTPYPTSWIVGVLWGAILWLELRVQVQSAHNQIYYDSLTGAQSRSYGEWFLDHTLTEGPVGVIFVDADEFKSINDRWGHAAGDDTLRRLTSALRSALRGHGVVVVWGVMSSYASFRMPNPINNLPGWIEHRRIQGILDVRASTDSSQLRLGMG